MVVSPEEYNSLLHRLMDPNKFTPFLRIPDDEPIYNIDLNTRTIEAPQFLSIEEDHNSEIIWFKANRFYDNIDLADSTCLIQYINADQEEYFYASHIMISADKYGTESILIPWAISRQVTKKTGTITFSFQFFKLSLDKSRFLYMLNTKPAKSKILAGLFVDPSKILDYDNIEENDAIPGREWLADKLRALEDSYSTLSKDYELYWIDV